jgi:hypothetical protein
MAGAAISGNKPSHSGTTVLISVGYATNFAARMLWAKSRGQGCLMKMTEECEVLREQY